jgi:hypothetical protein
MQVSKLQIYIAGPMRGRKFLNFHAFDKARDLLESYGFRPISPADMDRQNGFDATELPEDSDWCDMSKLGFSIDEAIARDVGALQWCDAIYLLSGWQNSKGAKAEKALAEWKGLAILYEEEFVEEDILEEAMRITKGDRQAAYGPPDQDFQRTAAIWSALKGVEFEPREVALFMIALKLSRETHQRKRDNWVDIAGYARCGHLCSKSSKKE